MEQGIRENWKDKWVEALRSGKYRQARRALRNKNAITGTTSFCCLGVLADVIDPKGWEPLHPRASSHSCPHALSVGSNSVLNELRLRDCGIELTAGKIGKLIEMNDSGKSFDEIADWIETEGNV